jgi:cysteine desulfurase / selenocysteine lyase
MIGLAYLNYAGLAPLRLRSALAGLFPPELAGNALLGREAGRVGRLREAVAAWLGMEPRNIALLPSTTAALGAVAAGIDWRPGDVVLYPAGDFGANVLPWEDLARREVRPVAVRDWAAPFPPQTRLVAISSVDWTSGDERPWREVCARARGAGIWTCLDAIQGAGVLPSVSPDVDFWAAGTQKWLVSGIGLAILGVSDRALAALEGPWRTWLGRADPRDPASPPAPDARRWELGWITPTALARFAATLRWLRPRERVVRERVLERRERLHERLLGMGYDVISDPSRPSGIVTARSPAALDARAIVADGYRRRIVIAERGGHLRLSAHVFTSEREIRRTLDWLDGIRHGRLVPAQPEEAR